MYKTNSLLYIIKTQENTAKSQVILDSCQKMSSLVNARLDNEIKKVNVLTDKCDKYKRQRDELIWLVIISIILTFRKVIIRFIKPL